MSRAYTMDNATAHTAELTRVHCKDESKELQSLLEHNFDLLPGDQIDPEQPRKWLLIKREMPVADPATGGDRWSIDFLFADQDGIPTFVECKRFNDTRTRREVIGQMLEYAANGHHYWSAQGLLAQAVGTNKTAEDLEARIDSIRGDTEVSPADFFVTVEANLRAAKLRLIFFLDKSPPELRSVVDFLNKQLTNSEVFIVEARQYSRDALTIVVPWLFGFTEEARVAKATTRKQTTLGPNADREEDFYIALRQNLDNDVSGGVTSMIQALSTAAEIDLNWRVNCIVMLKSILKRGLFAINRDGVLEVYGNYWTVAYSASTTAEQIAVMERFRLGLEGIFDVSFTEKDIKGFRRFSAKQWLPQSQLIAKLVLSLVPASTTNPQQMAQEQALPSMTA